MLRTTPMSLFALALLLPGCLLQTEPCGIDFVSVDDRCVPAVDPLPYRGDGDGFDPGPGRGDGSVDGAPPRDEGLADGALLDGSVPDFGPRPPLRPYRLVLIVDRTPPERVRNTPASPGADLDAVILVGVDGSFGYADEVSSAQINDPFGVSRWTDPNAVLGPPDASGFGEPGRLVSLGGEGGFALLDFPFGRDLFSGDQVQVVELDTDEAVDAYDVYLCPAPPLDAAECLLLARGSGALQAFVP